MSFLSHHKDIKVPKVDLQNTVFTGKLKNAANSALFIDFSAEDKALLGLSGPRRAYLKKKELITGLRLGDVLTVKLTRDALDYHVVDIVAKNGVDLHSCEPTQKLEL
jgi:hypothetical protein